MKFFQSVYRKITGKDVQKIQNDIISSFEQELLNTKIALQRSQDAEGVAIRGRRNALDDNRIIQAALDGARQENTRLIKQLHITENKPDVVERVFTMTQKVYDDLERSVEPPIVTNNTTPQGAGYAVGIQRVLAEVRKRYVAN